MTKRFLTTLITSIAVSALGGTCTHAQAASDTMPADVLVATLRGYKEAYIAQVMAPFRQIAGQKQFLTAADVATREAQVAARRRAFLMSMFFTADIDGDSKITQQDLDRAAVSPLLPQERFVAWDTNKDGIVTLDEALAYAKSQPAPYAAATDIQTGSALLALDPNGDGKLTAAELEQLASAAFARYDTDGDGFLSQSESTKLNSDQAIARNAALMRLRMEECNFPKIGPDEKLYVIGAYEAGTLSNVTVAGQDAETETAEINVEAGEGMIYIAATSYTPMIWRVTGHVERVAHFAASALGGVGVVGVSKDKVGLYGKRECLPRQGGSSVNQPILSSISASFGKEPTGIVQQYTVPRVSLPSDFAAPSTLDPKKGAGKPARVPFSLGTLTATDDEILASLKHFSPGGIETIDPQTVVAFGTAERYQVLPQEAGLLQILQDGLATRKADGYVINKPIARFPAGLAGAHSVHFYIANGVARPAGNPGHSTVTVIKP